MDLPQALCQALPGLSWPAALDAQLRARLPGRSLAAGQTLFAQGQHTRAFYLVGSGELEARLGGADGAVSVLGRMPAGQLFGLAGFVTGRPSSYEAVAHGDSRVWVIGEPAYTLMMDRWPGFARALMADFARHFDANLRLLQAARHQSAQERFELALQQLTHERGAVSDGEGFVALRITQAELAARAHLSRQTINELLARAREQGRVQGSYGRLRWRA